MNHCLGYSSATHEWNALKEVVVGLKSKLPEIQKVVERAGWNGWIQREDDDVWRWLANVRCLEEEIRALLEIWQPETLRETPVPALCNFTSCFRPGMEPAADVKLELVELSGKVKNGFKDEDVMKFNNISYSESADRNKRPLTTCELRVLPVRQQIYEKDDFLKYYIFPAPGEDCNAQEKVVNITGIEGRGKTTLAQMVYSDERVQEYFQVRRWVCVGNPLNRRECINRVRREVVEAEDGVDVGVDEVASFLSGKRFLLVLDDVYDYDYLPSTESGAPGSRILVTSRKPVMPYHIVDRIINFVGAQSVIAYPYFVDALSTASCWSILKQTALSGKPQLRRKVGDIGRKFAQECGGSPLGAKIVGEYLKSKQTAQEWEDALTDETWQVEMMGVLSRLRNPGRFADYEKLYPELKHCFSYCAIFPKDFQINADMLVALWAAVGCIHLDTDVLTALDDNGSQFTRSIHKHKITSYKLSINFHDVVRYTSPHLTMLGQQKKLYSEEAQSLQSFVIVSHCQLPKDLFRRLKFVKALVLSSCKLEQLSSLGEVASLDLLQLLDLSGNPLKLLPETIGDLKCLESLFLSSCYLLRSLPQRIGELEHLRNLRISYTTDSLHNLPQGFEKLTSITTLDVFRVGGTYDNIGKLRDLNHLIDIRISVHGTVCFSDAHLESKTELENLELCFVGKGRDREMAPCVEKMVPPPNLEMLLIEDYHGFILPMWILINSLKRLSLRSAVNISSLPPLWKLPNLEFLWLYDMPKITHIGSDFFGQNVEDSSSEDEDGEITEEGHGKREEEAAAFRSLKTLRIEYMQNWETWEDAKFGDMQLVKLMPSLDQLIISGCPKLQQRPLRILRDTPWLDNYSTWSAESLRIYNSIHEVLTVDVGGKHGSTVQKLKDLDCDEYRISIAVHGNVHFLEAGLENKTEVEYLELCFVGDGRNKDNAQCIEDLVPPSYLETLRIDDYPGPTLPKWIINSESTIWYTLRRLSVRSSPYISSFPNLWRLLHLDFLWLFDIPSVKCLGLEFFGYSKTGQHQDIMGGEAFPNLTTLRLEYLQNWETWEDIDVVEADKEGISVMPCLEELIIGECPKFQGKPQLLRILRGTPWSKKQHKPSTSTDKETEIELHGDELHHMNDQNNDNPSTSNSKGKEKEIDQHHGDQTNDINDHTNKTSTSTSKDEISVTKSAPLEKTSHTTDNTASTNVSGDGDSWQSLPPNFQRVHCSDIVRRLSGDQRCSLEPYKMEVADMCIAGLCMDTKRKFEPYNDGVDLLDWGEFKGFELKNNPSPRLLNAWSRILNGQQPDVRPPSHFYLNVIDSYNCEKDNVNMDEIWNIGMRECNRNITSAELIFAPVCFTRDEKLVGHYALLVLNFKKCQLQFLDSKVHKNVDKWNDATTKIRDELSIWLEKCKHPQGVAVRNFEVVIVNGEWRAGSKKHNAAIYVMHLMQTYTGDTTALPSMPIVQMGSSMMEKYRVNFCCDLVLNSNNKNRNKLSSLVAYHVTFKQYEKIVEDDST